jgi:hypothetical protein
MRNQPMMDEPIGILLRMRFLRFLVARFLSCGDYAHNEGRS